jgi:hypothetical protein
VLPSPAFSSQEQALNTFYCVFISSLDSGRKAAVRDIIQTGHGKGASVTKHFRSVVFLWSLRQQALSVSLRLGAIT